MKILEINNGKSFFLINEKRIPATDLSRNDLLSLLNTIYEYSEPIEDIEIPSENEMKSIKNNVESEVVHQLMNKIKDFINNVTNLKNEMEEQFPDIDTEII